MDSPPRPVRQISCVLLFFAISISGISRDVYKRQVLHSVWDSELSHPARSDPVLPGMYPVWNPALFLKILRPHRFCFACNSGNMYSLQLQIAMRGYPFGRQISQYYSLPSGMFPGWFPLPDFHFFRCAVITYLHLRHLDWQDYLQNRVMDFWKDCLLYTSIRTCCYNHRIILA